MAATGRSIPTTNVNIDAKQSPQDRVQAMLHRMAQVQIEEAIARHVDLNILEERAERMTRAKVGVIANLARIGREETSWMALDHAKRSEGFRVGRKITLH